MQRWSNGSAWRETSMPSPSSSSSSSSSSLYSSFEPNNINFDTDQHLPTYNPLSHVAQREHSRLRSAHKAVHLIPLLVLFCAIILWLFSAPTSSPVNQPTKHHKDSAHG